MATVKEIMTAIAPQFPDDASRDTFIELAELRTNACFYGSKYNLAVALMAAHTMTLASQAESTGGEVTGAVTSKREGDLSISYAQPSSSGSAASGDLSSTSYGSQLLGIRKGCRPFMGVTGHWNDTPPALEGFNDC